MKWHDYGESSLTLLAVHCGIDKRTPCIPFDRGDFKRCLHLFDCIELSGSEVNNLISKAAEKYKVWKPIKDNWNKLLDAYFCLNENRFYELISQFHGSRKDD